MAYFQEFESEVNSPGSHIPKNWGQVSLQHSEIGFVNELLMTREAFQSGGSGEEVNPSFPSPSCLTNRKLAAGAPPARPWPFPTSAISHILASPREPVSFPLWRSSPSTSPCSQPEVGAGSGREAGPWNSKFGSGPHSGSVIFPFLEVGTDRTTGGEPLWGARGMEKSFGSLARAGLI